MAYCSRRNFLKTGLAAGALARNRRPAFDGGTSEGNRLGDAGGNPASKSRGSRLAPAA